MNKNSIVTAAIIVLAVVIVGSGAYALASALSSSEVVEATEHKDVQRWNDSVVIAPLSPVVD